MSFDTRALRQHASCVSTEQLSRSRRLRALSADERDAVSQLAEAIADGIVLCLVNEAGGNLRLERALEEIYGRREGPAPVNKALAAPGARPA